MAGGRSRSESSGRGALSMPSATQAGPSPARAWQAVRWFMRGVTGADAYERYCAHLRAAHPTQPVPDERTFWKEKWADQERNPRARCC